MKAAFLALLLFLIAPGAQAQLPCSEADPCPIAIDVDDASLTIADGSSYTVTAGDWFYLDLFNTDDPDHDIAIADLDILFTAPGLDGDGPESIHGPYAMDAPGSYTVEDLTTGASATLHVVEHDVAEDEALQGEDAPGLGFIAFTMMLAGLLLVRRK